MVEIKDKNFFTVQGWMVSKTNLSGNELLAYAIIYGFSQDGQSVFSGTTSYLAGWLGLTKTNAWRVLQRLVAKGLVEKIDKVINGVKLCDYRAIVPDDTDKHRNNIPVAETATPVIKTITPVIKTITPVIKTITPVIKTATHNINDNINDIKENKEKEKKEKFQNLLKNLSQNIGYSQVYDNSFPVGLDFDITQLKSKIAGFVFTTMKKLEIDRLNRWIQEKFINKRISTQTIIKVLSRFQKQSEIEIQNKYIAFANKNQ